MSGTQVAESLSSVVLGPHLGRVIPGYEAELQQIGVQPQQRHLPVVGFPRKAADLPPTCVPTGFPVDVGHRGRRQVGGDGRRSVGTLNGGSWGPRVARCLRIRRDQCAANGQQRAAGE